MTTRPESPPLILLRADGDAAVGSGHLRRCLALADRLRAGGYECMFACCGGPRNFNGLVRQAGFELIELGDERFNADQDIERTMVAVGARAPFAAVVVDHYGLGAEWEAKIRAITSQVTVIDDLADRPHDCDVLIDVAPGDETRYDGLAPAGCRKLLGPAYALLRPEFADRARCTRDRSGAVDRILISFGGTDAENLTGRAVAAIRGVRPDVSIDAVLTGLSSHLDALRRLDEEDARLSLHVDATNMADLMTRADLAIGAGGSTSWERACLGLPSIIAVIADNQAATARALEDACAAVAVPVGPGFESELQQCVQWLSVRPVVVRAMARAGAGLVDGRGVARVVRAIASPKLTIRRATAGDARKVWTWRNAPEIRATATNPAEIGWEDHRAWFSLRLEDPGTVMLIGAVADKEVGLVRFDLEGDTATVSIFLAPGQQGRGSGRALLQAGEQWITDHCRAVSRFRADVRPGNDASIALFRGADYRPRLFSFERAVND